MEELLRMAKQFGIDSKGLSKRRLRIKISEAIEKKAENNEWRHDPINQKFITWHNKVIHYYFEEEEVERRIYRKKTAQRRKEEMRDYDMKIKKLLEIAVELELFPKGNTEEELTKELIDYIQEKAKNLIWRNDPENQKYIGWYNSQIDF